MGGGVPPDLGGRGPEGPARGDARGDARGVKATACNDGETKKAKLKREAAVFMGCIRMERSPGLETFDALHSSSVKPIFRKTSDM